MSPGRSAAVLAGAVALVGCRSPADLLAEWLFGADAGKAAPRGSGAPGIPAIPGIPAAPDDSPSHGDHMHLETDGLQKDVWSQGWTSIPHPDCREYAYAGPLGCGGPRFTTKLTRSTRLDIGYTAHKAFVIVGEEPYVLAKPPVVQGGALVWDGTFKSAGGQGRWFRLMIDCPLPAK